MRICHTCYREFPESQIKRFLSGEITDMCITCDTIIGKGAGYTDEVNEKTSYEWFKGVGEREKKLKDEGKL